MPSFRHTVPMSRAGRAPEALSAMRAVLKAVTRANEFRLNQPLRPFTQILTMANVALARLRGPARSTCLDPAQANAANHCFSSLFAGHVAQWTTAAMADPSAYRDKINAYENQGHRPDIPFDTETDYYRLIVRDPLRIQEEHFVYHAILHNGRLAGGDFSALDLGTGSGRLAFCIADLVQRCIAGDGYEIYGLDINPHNIKDALTRKAGGSYGPELKFVTGDMCLAPFVQDNFSFCSATSSLYLVPAYARPLCILEMVRILKPGGEGVITGPNEYFSLRDYSYCMGASNFTTYINPLNMYLAQKLGPTGVLIDRAAAQRLDFAFPDTSHLCLALEKAGCEITQVEYWPQSNVQPVYSAVRFRKTKASAELMEPYNRYLRKLIEERGIKPI